MLRRTVSSDALAPTQTRKALQQQASLLHTPERTATTPLQKSELVETQADEQQQLDQITHTLQTTHIHSQPQPQPQQLTQQQKQTTRAPTDVSAVSSSPHRDTSRCVSPKSSLTTPGEQQQENGVSTHTSPSISASPSPSSPSPQPISPTMATDKSYRGPIIHSRGGASKSSAGPLGEKDVGTGGMVSYVMKKGKGMPAACLFVASLATTRPDEELLDSVTTHFEQWGDLMNVKVLKDWLARPYAFVQYEKVEDANRALIEAQNTKIQNRHIRVEQAKVNRTLFIARLARYTLEEIREILERFGSVEDINILQNYQTGKSKGCGFIKFVYREDALRAFTGLRQQYEWVVEWASNLDRNSSEVDSKSIFVGQINQNTVTQDLLEERFSKYGEILSMQLINKNQGPPNPRPAFAFITYADDVSAERAIHEEHESNWLDRSIRVQYREVDDSKMCSHRPSSDKKMSSDFSPLDEVATVQPNISQTASSQSVIASPRFNSQTAPSEDSSTVQKSSSMSSSADQQDECEEIQKPPADEAPTVFPFSPPPPPTPNLSASPPYHALQQPHYLPPQYNAYGQYSLSNPALPAYAISPTQTPRPATPMPFMNTMYRSYPMYYPPPSFYPAVQMPGGGGAASVAPTARPASFPQPQPHPHPPPSLSHPYAMPHYLPNRRYNNPYEGYLTDQTYYPFPGYQQPLHPSQPCSINAAVPTTPPSSAVHQSATTTTLKTAAANTATDPARRGMHDVALSETGSDGLRSASSLSKNEEKSHQREE